MTGNMLVNILVLMKAHQIIVRLLKYSCRDQLKNTELMHSHLKYL